MGDTECANSFLVNCFVTVLLPSFTLSLLQRHGLKIRVLVILLSSKRKLFSALLSCHFIRTNSLTLYPSGIQDILAFKMCEPNFICSDFSFYPLICHYFFTMSKASTWLEWWSNSEAHNFESDPKSIQSKIFSNLIQTLHFALG